MCVEIYGCRLLDSFTIDIAQVDLQQLLEYDFNEVYFRLKRISFNYDNYEIINIENL